jgi:hypothetical protein
MAMITMKKFKIISVVSIILFVGYYFGVFISIFPSSIWLSNGKLSLGYQEPHWGKYYVYREFPSLRYSCTCGKDLPGTEICEVCP